MPLFGPRCEHHWQETHRDVQRRAGHFKFGGGFFGEEAADAMYGCTHIELRCEKCGDVRSRKLRGEHPSESPSRGQSGVTDRGVARTHEHTPRRDELPPVDYGFTDEIAVTLPGHQWQLLLRASHDEMLDEAKRDHYGLAQAHHEIAAMYRLARAAQKGPK